MLHTDEKHNADSNTSLIDPEGYPRGDIDVVNPFILTWISANVSTRSAMLDQLSQYYQQTDV